MKLKKELEELTNEASPTWLCDINYDKLTKQYVLSILKIKNGKVYDKEDIYVSFSRSLVENKMLFLLKNRNLNESRSLEELLIIAGLKK